MPEYPGAQLRFPNSFRIGEKYEVRGFLGAGGMATVIRAKELGTENPREVALKIMRRERAELAEEGDYITNEAKVLGELSSHPNSVAFYGEGAFEQNMGDTPVTYRYLAMEYIDGITLDQAIHGHGKISQLLTLGLTSLIIDLLAAAAKRGEPIYHRDVKPENIMLTKDGRVVLLDWGLSKVEGIAGTPVYMSPEQTEGEPIDERSDMFSLGVSLWEMLTGEKAFSGMGFRNAYYQKLREGLPEIPDINPLLQALVKKMNKPKRADRYRDYDRLKTEFNGLKLVMGFDEEKFREELGQLVSGVTEEMLDEETPTSIFRDEGVGMTHLLEDEYPMIYNPTIVPGDKTFTFAGPFATSPLV
ncbi:MAG: serine/threonine-protein kinase [Candidatus Margulisiibacteriota bacterium]